MLHETWKERTPIKKVEVTNTDAKIYSCRYANYRQTV